DDARRWIERGVDAARAGKETEHLPRLLALAASVANLRGEYAKAAAYQAEMEKIAPAEKSAETEIASGGTLVVAMANPIAAQEPVNYQTTEEHEVLANIFETLVTTDAGGNLSPLLCDRWSLEDGAKTLRVYLRPHVVFSDGSPLTAATVKASLERSIRLASNDIPAAFEAIEGVAEFGSGAAREVEGIRARSGLEIELRLHDALPTLPSLLTDGRASIVAVDAEGRSIGTGPYLRLEHTADR